MWNAMRCWRVTRFARKLDDYGIDLVLTTYNNRGEIEDGSVLFQ